jgi:hypothetical protein
MVEYGIATAEEINLVRCIVSEVGPRFWIA